MKRGITIIVMLVLIIIYFITGRDAFESFGYVKEFKDIEPFVAILMTILGLLIWCGIFAICLALVNFYHFIKTVLFGK